MRHARQRGPDAVVRGTEGGEGRQQQQLVGQRGELVVRDPDGVEPCEAEQVTGQRGQSVVGEAELRERG